ncbi:MAG: micrococcal nuclease [Candidatus Nitrosomirales archaeon]|jgi:micrococcal nuclease
MQASLALIIVGVIVGSILAVAFVMRAQESLDKAFSEPSDAVRQEERERPIEQERERDALQHEYNGSLCTGSARCFTGKVTRIVDGDTLDVSDIRIRLALVNTPEQGQPLYREARQFTASLCPVGSTVLVDQDDGQLEGSFDRMIGKVFCGDKVLNAELLDAGLAEIFQRFCSESEFSNEDWARRYGC